MNKKLIALILSCVMLITASPAVAAEDAPVKPSVEEILNDYHQKAFESQNSEKLGTATTNSNRSGAKTLEQETVDTLNAAGYEAYNVTASNYDTLEAQLNTDFASLGLDPDCSYIVVISGEESGNTNGTRGYGDNLITPTPEPGEDIGPAFFKYTYNGKTYNMRYITVTATDNTHLGQIEDIDLLTKYGPNDLWSDLNLPITIASTVGILPYTGTIYSLFSLILPEYSNPQAQQLIYSGGTNWTVTYIQIYDFQELSWKKRACSEYVTMRYFIDFFYYDYDTNQYEKESTDGIYGIFYSSLYNNNETMKEKAAFAEEYSTYWFDTVEEVTYKFNGEVVMTHQRWAETASYEPG